MNFGTKLKYQKRGPVLKTVYKWIFENLPPVVKTPVIIASLLLENYRIFPNLYIDENAKVTFTEAQLLKKKDKLPQYADDNLSSQNSRLCLTLTLFFSVFDAVHEHSHSGSQFAQYILNQY